ncbi:two-component system LytT family response regulator/two-component system response regulator LytT [Granulicella aggregans]|uniref:Two-component system LytT family response regulator/two-component system response regulator LytT n=1 Tax=Granulicella aggregans TaxID=474949 RepID=A0A7W7ZF13_9BACT|nr:LytTR family DNA-binding domain-containing protein [Granulicella aggregans]MBB5058704.1 two-component system LytT family response regulator/two-component system response regulator LytT [Granulicella aggregans]
MAPQSSPAVTPGLSGPIPSPNRITAIVVDDEPLARQELVYLLEQADGLEVLAQGTNGIEAVDLIRSLQPDLVFLDVQMPGLDGFAVLKKLLDKKIGLPQVVFATAFDQYAVRAFEVNAVDYLLKPFDRSRVLKTIEKARARIATPQEISQETPVESDSESRINALLKLMEEQVQAPRLSSLRPQIGKVVVRAQNRLLLVDQREICYASIEDGEINVFAAAVDGQSNCRTLEELMDLLDPAMFWRVHRSFVVNIQHIREVVPWFKSSYQLRMDDSKKTEIPVSRAQTKRLRELFNL